MCSLADACVLVGDERRGLQLYELLLPHESDNAVTYTQQPFGPVALRLGKLAALLERWEDAEGHFATALERCELLCARAIRARVLLEHARALAARGEAGDRERIAAMLEEAAALCDELGMTGLLERFSTPSAGIRRSRRASGCGLPARGGVLDDRLRGADVPPARLKGLRYIASLLASPGREMHVLELVSAATGVGPALARGSPRTTLSTSWPSDLDAVLDDQAKKDYGRRLEELEEELEQARDWGDTERAARMEERARRS